MTNNSPQLGPLGSPKMDIPSFLASPDSALKLLCTDDDQFFSISPNVFNKVDSEEFPEEFSVDGLSLDIQPLNFSPSAVQSLSLLPPSIPASIPPLQATQQIVYKYVVNAATQTLCDMSTQTTPEKKSRFDNRVPSSLLPPLASAKKYEKENTTSHAHQKNGGGSIPLGRGITIDNIVVTGRRRPEPGALKDRPLVIPPKRASKKKRPLQEPQSMILQQDSSSQPALKKAKSDQGGGIEESGASVPFDFNVAPVTIPLVMKRPSNVFSNNKLPSRGTKALMKATTEKNPATAAAAGKPPLPASKKQQGHEQEAAFAAPIPISTTVPAALPSIPRIRLVQPSTAILPPVPAAAVAEEEEVPTASYDATKCEICGEGYPEASLLLCDGCDLGYHMECLIPALTKVPEGDWFCHCCIRKQKAAAAALTIRLVTNSAPEKSKETEVKEEGEGEEAAELPKMSKSEAGMLSRRPRPEGKLTRARRSELQILLHVARTGHTMEAIIREHLGDNLDISKAMRKLRKEGKIEVVGGKGGRYCPITYRLNPSLRVEIDEWVAELETDKLATEKEAMELQNNNDNDNNSNGAADKEEEEKLN